jgi:hypothetical protein
MRLPARAQRLGEPVTPPPDDELKAVRPRKIRMIGMIRKTRRSADPRESGYGV